MLYGTYEPLSVTITHIINNKSGISFTSYSHTGLPVAVLAHGVNAEAVQRLLRQHQIYHQAGRHAGRPVTVSSHFTIQTEADAAPAAPACCQERTLPHVCVV